MTCVFCGKTTAGRRAKEHIVPRWALDEFGIRDDQVLATHFSATGQVLSDRLHTMNNLLSGRVCIECNSGWMSAMESANKQLIIDLARERRDTLDLGDCAALGLARWAFKTSLALHAASNYRPIVPKEHYRHLVDHDNSLPQGVHVVGKSWELPHGFSWVQSPSWFVHQPGREPTPNELAVLRVEGYKICLQLSELLLLVAFNPIPRSRVLMWKFLHVPLYPRRGPVVWLQREPELPGDEPFAAAVAFHGSFGIVPQ